MPLFPREIGGWDDWSRLFQSIEAFTPLIRHISAQHGLPGDTPVENLTPGTNAVFALGDKVYKIFAPLESTLGTQRDFLVELDRLRVAERVGIPTSKVLFHGEIHDRYLFRYLILERLHGPEAGDVIFHYHSEQIRCFVRDVGKLLERFHLPAGANRDPGRLLAISRDRQRMDGLPLSLVKELESRAAWAVEEYPHVLVHGDVTGENVLVLPDGPALIDFADSVYAPVQYELGALLFALYRCDPRFVQACLDGGEQESFLEDVLTALSLHDFRGDLLKAEFYPRFRIDPAAVTGVARLKEALRRAWFS